MSKAKLGSALYKLRKAKGLLEEPKSNRSPFARVNNPAATRPSNTNRSPVKPTVWSHDKYGVITANSCDLIRMFPQHSLSESGLSRVRLGKQANHKGWKVFKKAATEVSPYYKDLQERGA